MKDEQNTIIMKEIRFGIGVIIFQLLFIIIMLATGLPKIINLIR